ncbi:MAG: TadE/TadG family type IV pilus assembly protein [Ilumatobacteraceae bacterium]
MATVIVFPALLLSFWLVLQYAFVAHVRHVAQAAAQDASIAAAAGSGDPEAVAGELMAGSAGSMASGVQVASSVGPEQATVTVSADVLQVFPLGDFHVSVTASAPIERFVPQPERP